MNKKRAGSVRPLSADKLKSQEILMKIRKESPKPVTA